MIREEESATPTRRARVREATLTDIRAAARELLVSEGSPAVTVNATARKLGMSGPALYRYYESQAALMEGLRRDLYGELIGTMRAAADEAETPGCRLLAISRTLRGWALKHPAEFRWLFASPAPDRQDGDCDAADGRSSRAFGEVFLEQVVAIWRTKRFPVPNLDDKDPSIARQVQLFSERIDGQLPPEATYVFLACWIRLYGLLCTEALNQVSFAFTDLEPVFEECLQELCRLLDIPYEPPLQAGDREQGSK